ncbi:hypothetical protein C7212DRAFT_356921 [Tuber magnatum]|uniref:Tafazzin n=1 Tax=Tuber magnatum TaxID=42249 RepID=A0A317SVB4_9PEZI|nr:hypothetical protein C7212DRAFT_356921 [Tuber magnatum]
MVKRHKPKFPKPTPDPHAYFKKGSACAAKASSAAPGAGGNTSVNSILARLRSEATIKEIGSIYQGILENAAPPPPPPARRIVVGAGMGGRMRGRVPGPPPPASWLYPEVQGDQGPVEVNQQQSASEGVLVRGVQHPLSYLPGMTPVDDRRLLHYALKAMSLRWEEHILYDQHWLQHLPPNVKTLLLSYIATYAPTGVTLSGLKVLFKCPDEDITTLELSRSLNAELMLPQLMRFLRPKKRPQAEVSASWEDEMDDRKEDTGKGYTSLFPNLTHLSLAYPDVPVPFSQLLTFAASVPPTITHLSLAGWAEHTPDGMKRLARNLLGLKWLDVSNCHWVLYEQLKDVEWCGPWRNVETVVARQHGDVPPTLKAARDLRVRELKKAIRGVRNERGGKWCNVVFDEDGDRGDIAL